VNRHTAVSPAGRPFTRDSYSRIYSHAVFVASTNATARAEAADEVLALERRLAELVRLPPAQRLPIYEETVARLRQWIDDARAQVAVLAQLDPRKPAEWHVLTWAGRLDLAERALRSQEAQAWAYVEIVPASVARA
jgi:hypothetical protein